MLEEDWMMRQIRDMVQFLSATILHKDTARAMSRGRKSRPPTGSTPG